MGLPIGLLSPDDEDFDMLLDIEEGLKQEERLNGDFRVAEEKEEFEKEELEAMVRKEEEKEEEERKSPCTKSVIRERKTK